MRDATKPRRTASEVAMWHRLSGMPDDVTDEGEVVSADERQRQQTDKDLLRAEIASLREDRRPDEVRTLARLAASYLIAGDVETARRYINTARDLVSQDRVR